MFTYTHNFNPVFFSVNLIGLQLDIRWYSLAYVFGLLITNYWIKYCNKKSLVLNEKAYENWLLFAIIGIIVGGRLGYVLFYQSQYYWQNPLDILKVWQGGMSFHGGLIGSAVSMLLFSKIYLFPCFWLFDRLAVIAPIGLFFGRVANFINGELYGRISNSFIGVIFPYTDNLPRHPSQLYEAILEGLLLFTIMLFAFFYKNNYFAQKKPKFLSGLFLIGYSIARFVVEFFRQPDEQIGFLWQIFTLGQILCLPTLFLGCYLVFLSFKKNATTNN
jgi:phosphatidylglycerol:prolipoprotein diacylglycerol transferase